MRHYRKYYTKQLEDVPEVMGTESTFIHEHIYKAKIASQGLFGGQSSPKDSTAVETGVFKGYIQVFNQQRKDQRIQIIENLFQELDGLIKDAYLLQVGQEWPMKYEELMDPPDDVKLAIQLYKQFNDNLNKCGLGLLNIDEFWKSYLYQKHMLATLEI